MYTKATELSSLTSLYLTVGEASRAMNDWGLGILLRNTAQKAPNECRSICLVVTKIDVSVSSYITWRNTNTC